MTVQYSMRISRLTVDKLGVKLYDKVSAVIAELIANAYDADATCVTVHAPMGQFLASRAGGVLSDKGLSVEVIDNGVGMTPQQVQDFFLVVGAERRNDTSRGDRSARFNRKVMGRKGVGKLAPFGICKKIEVISAGGEPVETTEAQSQSDKKAGYLTSHIILKYEDIIKLGDEPDERYQPIIGELDNSFSSEAGTRIILSDFNFRKVPELSVLERQLAQRFGIKTENWKIRLKDNTNSDSTPQTVGDFGIETMPNTELTFRPDKSTLSPNGNRDPEFLAGFDHEGKFYPVTGWMAYSKSPYADELMAGVRIYCRGKIAAQTSIFGQRAGFTGEHNVRSYLVGELHADWLDEADDLIQTDRRDILWSDELARAFQDWGQRAVKRIGKLSRNPMRKATLELFFEKGDVEARILDSYPGNEHQEIRESAKEIAKTFGRTISRGEVYDDDIVSDMVDLSISLAPHATLNSKMHEAADSYDTPLSFLSSLLRTARLAELASFGRIAEDRLKVIDRLETLKDEENSSEDDLQQLITDAPWLINPEWAPVTENRTFLSLRREFQKFFKSRTGKSISLADFRDKSRRPDFVLSNQEGMVQIIEIKKPKHKLSNEEMDRIIAYHDNMAEFLEAPNHKEFSRQFSDFHVTLVCDELALTGAHHAAFDGYLAKGKLTHMDWAAFLLKTERIHEDFLKEAHRQRDASYGTTGKI